MTALRPPLAEALRDRYTLEQELGRGGMATVYLARDLRHQRYVALKVLTPELATAVGVERFHREIQLAASLQHPHVLPVHDSGAAAGTLWYTMPYVEGESLRERLRQEHRLAIDEAIGLARQVADALDCAHAAGIVHRDIKPENILLSRGHALVADFGIARAVEEAGETLTATGLIVGTPAYMSPEQAGATGHPIDARSDIYSLGCVLYEMLTGERPFAGPTPQALIARRVLDPAPDARVARPEVPAAVAAIVTRCLALEPGERFATASELAAALVSAILGSSGAPPVAVAVAGRRLSRGRLAAAAAMTLLLLAGAAWLAQQHAVPSAFDATLLAVAPFDVLDPELGLWHEGLMDVLSRTLDGAGPMRTVSPTVVARRWRGRAESTSAAELARATGAARVLYGAVIPAGRDSVRLTASLFDARDRRAVTEYDIHGPRDRVDRLADSLTLVVLRTLAPPTGLPRLAGSPLGTASPAALKAYLEGEQHYRRSQFDSAHTAFRKSVALDSGFALAWHRLSHSIQWRDSLSYSPERDPDIALTAFRAAGIRSLSLRDSLVLTADSLFWALFVAQDTAFLADEPVLDDSFWSLHTRLFTTLQQAYRRYPHDPEVVLAVGEAGWQWGGAIGIPFEQTLALYDRVIALDSAFTPSYPHAAFLALAAGDPGRALGYIQAHRRWGTPTSVGGAMWLMQALLTPGPAAGGRAERLLDSLPISALSAAFELLSMSADSNESVVRVARALIERNPGVAQTWSAGLASALGARGHLREMLEVGRRTSQAPWTGGALVTILPADSLRGYRARWLRTTDPNHEQPPPSMSWLASEGDTVVLAHLAAVHRRGSLDQRSTQAFLALARHDTAGAVAHFLALPDSAMLLWITSRIVKAQLLRATGHVQEAARTLRPSLSPWASDYYPGDGFWHLERGRTYERLGDRPAARRAYRTVADLWRHPDPELRPLAEEARQAVRRLGP